MTRTVTSSSGSASAKASRTAESARARPRTRAHTHTTHIHARACSIDRWRCGAQALMRGQLERLLAAPGLSKDTAEIAARTLRDP